MPLELGDVLIKLYDAHVGSQLMCATEKHSTPLKTPAPK